MVKKHPGKRSDAATADHSANDGSEWRSDPRFGHLATDPRYRSAAVRKATRVQIDSRFKAMFADPDFTTDVRSDKRGRPMAMSSRNDLSRFYGLKEDDAEASAEDDKEKREASENSAEGAEEDEKLIDEENEYVDSAEDEEDECNVEADESEEKVNDSNSDDEEFRALKRSVTAESSDNTESSLNPTNRLAVTQQDWGQLKATDLYMLLTSHCPATRGSLLSVTIYPSRFGLRRMTEEVEKGPLELAAAAAKTSSTAATDSAAADTAYRRSLRWHQEKRLWYYYAIAEFVSSEAAASVFDQCYGLEIESTGCCLRLSYVPAGMQFGGPDDLPDEWCHLVTKCSGIDPAIYKPGKFSIASLGRTRVGLTWDETPAERTRYLQGLFGKAEFDEADPDLNRLSEFLALSSEDEYDGGPSAESTASASAAKRRALLGRSDDAEPADEYEGSIFSDDELPDDIAAAAAVQAVSTEAAQIPTDSRKRTRRHRLREQAKRARLTKAGLLPPAAGGGSSEDNESEVESGAATAEIPASELELSMLVADRPLGQAGGRRGRVTAANVVSDARFGALFTDPSYHVDPTHSEAAKAAEIQRHIISAKKRAAMDT